MDQLLEFLKGETKKSDRPVLLCVKQVAPTASAEFVYAIKKLIKSYNERAVESDTRRRWALRAGRPPFSRSCSLFCFV